MDYGDILKGLLADAEKYGRLAEKEVEKIVATDMSPEDAKKLGDEIQEMDSSMSEAMSKAKEAVKAMQG